MVQLLPFSLARFLLTTASTHLKHLPEVVLKFSGFGRANTLLISRTRLILFIKIIFNPFDLLYVLVFAFERKVPRIKASVFKGHLLDFILVDSVVDKRSKTSAPPFVWSYTTHTLGFFRWSFVVLTWSWMVDNRITFFLSLFYLST